MASLRASILNHHKSNKNSQGFTLTELLVTLAIFSFVVGLTLVVSMDAYRSYNFRVEQNLLVGLLQKARSQAVNNINQKPHGLRINQSPGQYVLFQGDSYDSRDATQDIIFPANTSFTLTGLNEAVFAQLTGSPSTSGNISLDDHIHPIINIAINNEGQINLH